MNLAMETDDYPLPYYRSAKSLQSIVLEKIAAVLWHHKIHNADPEKKLSDYWLRSEQLDINDFPPIPKLIGEEICGYFRQFGLRLSRWLDGDKMVYFSSLKIDPHSNADILRKCIDCIDLDDVKRTAKKLIDSHRFSAKKKYLIACVCCFRDDIERLWPLVSHDTTITRMKQPVWVYYWNCRMKGVSPKRVRGNPYHSIEARVLDNASRYNEVTEIRQIDKNWLAVEYFWDALSANERLSLMDAVLTCLEPADIVKFLPKLTNAEIHRLLEAKVGFIVSQLSMHPDLLDYAIQVWSHYCKSATEMQVYESVKIIFKNAFVSNQLDSGQALRLSAALYQIWINTPDALKTVVLRDESIEEFFNLLTARDHYSIIDDDYEAYFHARNMDFLLKILQSADLPRRGEIWRRSWPTFVFMAQPSYLEQFLKLCCENDRNNIVTEMMDLNRINLTVLLLSLENNIMQLGNFIDFCTTDELRRVELKKEVLAMCLRFGRGFSGLLEAPHIQFIYVDDLDEFVEKTFSTRRASKQFFTECVLAYEEEFFEQALHKDYVFQHYHPLKFASYFSFDLFSAKNRSKFLESYRTELVLYGVYAFDIDLWHKFITECATDHEDIIVQFKQSLPIDEIFHQTIPCIFPPQTFPKCYNAKSVQDFLLWYFGCLEAVREYQFSRLQHYMHYKEYLQNLSSKPALNDDEVNEAYNYVVLRIRYRTDWFKSGVSSTERA